MSALPPYNPTQPCLKCGAPATSIRTQYFSENELGPYKSAAWLVTSVERLQRTCGNCGYQWLEAPLNRVLEAPSNAE